MYSNNIGFEAHHLTPPANDGQQWLGEQEAQARNEIIAAWRSEALRQMREELDAEDLAATTEDDIENWAIDIAAENGDSMENRMNWVRWVA